MMRSASSRMRPSGLGATGATWAMAVASWLAAALSASAATQTVDVPIDPLLGYPVQTVPGRPHDPNLQAFYELSSRLSLDQARQLKLEVRLEQHQLPETGMSAIHRVIYSQVLRAWPTNLAVTFPGGTNSLGFQAYFEDRNDGDFTLTDPNGALIESFRIVNRTFEGGRYVDVRFKPIQVLVTDLQPEKEPRGGGEVALLNGTARTFYFDDSPLRIHNQEERADYIAVHRVSVVDDRLLRSTLYFEIHQHGDWTGQNAIHRVEHAEEQPIAVGADEVAMLANGLGQMEWRQVFTARNVGAFDLVMANQPFLSSVHVDNFDYPGGRNATVQPRPVAWRKVKADPPRFELHPVSQTVLLDEPVEFQVGAFGKGPISYQWFKEGVAIEGATTTRLVFPRAQAADEGRYHVVATNPAGSTSSDEVSLTVNVPASTPDLAKSLSGYAGGSLTVETVVHGDQPMHLEWLKNGVPFAAGQGVSSFALAPLELTDGGRYVLYVSNQFGRAYSQPIDVRVSDTPVTLRALGPGILSFRSPRPHRVGQTVELAATPILGARFVAWEDGLTSTQRSYTIDQAPAEVTARFEYLPFNPERPPRPAHPVAAGPPLEVPILEQGLLRLEVDLAESRTFSVVASTNLGEAPFATVPHALAPPGPLTTTPSTAGPGRVAVYVEPPDAPQGFYQLLFNDGTTSGPILLYSDVTRTGPGGEVLLFGQRLLGTVEVRASANQISSEALDATRIRALAPANPGQYQLTATVDGTPALGQLPLAVVPTNELPRLEALPFADGAPGGLLRLRGTNFAENADVYLGQQRLPVVYRDPLGTEVYVRLPAQPASGALAVESEGARTGETPFAIRPREHTPYIPALRVVSPAANAVEAAYPLYTPYVPTLRVWFDPLGLFVPNNPFYPPELKVEAP